MSTIKSVTTPQAVELACKYSEKPGTLKKWLASNEIMATSVTPDYPPWSQRSPVPACDAYMRNLTLCVARPVFLFRFFHSIHDAETLGYTPLREDTTVEFFKQARLFERRKVKFRRQRLYSYLCELRSIATMDIAPHRFNHFCADYGYDEDCRKAYESFLLCLKVKDRISALELSDEIIESFPQ